MATEHESSDKEHANQSKHCRLATDDRPLMNFTDNQSNLRFNQYVDDQDEDRSKLEQEISVENESQEANVQNELDEKQQTSMVNEQQSGSRSSNEEDEDNDNNNSAQDDDKAADEESDGHDENKEEDDGHGLDSGLSEEEILTDELGKALEDLALIPAVQSMKDQGLIKDLMNQNETLKREKLEIKNKFDQYSLSIDKLMTESEKAMQDMVIKYQAIKTENDVNSDLLSVTDELDRIKRENQRLKMENDRYKLQVDKLKEERNRYAADLHSIQSIIGSNEQLKTLNKEQK